MTQDLVSLLNEAPEAGEVVKMVKREA